MVQDSVSTRGRLATTVLALLVILWAHAPGWAAPGPGPRDKGLTEEQILEGRYVERVEVGLVLLQATVLTRRGEIVSGLGPSDFILTDEGEPRTITAFGTANDQPLKVAFLLDVSGSMAIRGKLERAKEAIHRFVDALTPLDKIALLIFADDKVVVRKGFTFNRWDFFRSLDSLEAYGQTALRDALARAPTILQGSSPGRKALVLISDGVDNASRMTVMESIQAARDVPVPIYAIGLSDLPGEMRREVRPAEGGRSFFEVLMEFGRQTGGALIPVFEPEELDAAVALVQERLRGQYLIGFEPSKDSTGEGYRRISLRSRGRGHRIITRQGYYPAR